MINAVLNSLRIKAGINNLAKTGYATVIGAVAVAANLSRTLVLQAFQKNA